jgi:hypothetical protein
MQAGGPPQPMVTWSHSREPLEPTVLSPGVLLLLQSHPGSSCPPDSSPATRAWCPALQRDPDSEQVPMAE